MQAIEGIALMLRRFGSDEPPQGGLFERDAVGAMKNAVEDRIALNEFNSGWTGSMLHAIDVHAALAIVLWLAINLRICYEVARLLIIA